MNPYEELDRQLLECVRLHFGRLAEMLYEEYKKKVGLRPESPPEEWNKFTDMITEVFEKVASGFIAEGFKNEIRNIMKRHGLFEK